MVLPVIYDSIPKGLKKFPNWVLWKLEDRKDKTGKIEIDLETGEPKKTKVPYMRNGKKADSANPDTWDKYDYIVSTRTESNGIGFVFSEDTGIIGIDWDEVRDPETGEWNQEILDEIKSLNSYAELSQSGTGAHVLVKGKIPGERRRKGNIEMYSNKRFFVVTGQRIEGTPVEIKENQEAINELYKKRFGEGKKEEKNNQHTNTLDKKLRSPEMTDEEVLNHCRKEANSEKFIKLYDKGDISGYTSASEARLALYGKIVFYTQEEKQVLRIFRQSKLAYGDWGRKSKHDIQTAVDNLTEVYNPEKKGSSIYPYTLNPKGVGKYQDIKDPEDPSKTKTILEYFLYTPTQVSALSDDLDGEQILYKIGIEHPVNGHIDLWKNQGELLTRSGVNKLLSEGLIGTDSSYKDITKYFMMDILRASKVAPKDFIAHKTGWKRDNTIFVAGNEAYSANRATPVNLTDKDTSESFTKAGTLEGWVKGCGWILQHDCARVNCYTVLSSVIAGLLKQPSPIIQNKGNTTSGKTLKSSVGVSMIGNPAILVKSADTTRTGAERDAIATDGMCSVLDEVGMLKSPDGLTYLLSNGRKKQRGTKEGREPAAYWFKSFILNGEFEFLKESAAQGEIGRLIECSWKLPTDAVNAKKTEVEIKENYGHIIPLFLSKLFSRMDCIKDRYSELCATLPSSDLDIGSRLKDSFALIIIAGEILEETFQEIGIEKKDPVAICERLYIENITSERVKPYWIRGLSLIYDEVTACKMEVDPDGEETGRFYYKGQMGGDTMGLYIDINTATFKDICDKYELKNTQLMQEWRDQGITEVDKPGKNGDKKSQKTVKENGKPKKVIKLIKSKVYEALDIHTPTDTEREKIDRAMLRHDVEKHLHFYKQTHDINGDYEGFMKSLDVEFPKLMQHYDYKDVMNLIYEIETVNLNN